jgi:hypothetical protein
VYAALRPLARESCPGQDRILDALIAAGELECALADADGSPMEPGTGETAGEFGARPANQQWAAIAGVTDALAGMLVSSAAQETASADSVLQVSAEQPGEQFATSVQPKGDVLLISNELSAGARAGAPGMNRNPARELLARLDSIRPPAQLQVSVHEGFAYYALHPLKIVSLLQELPVPPRAAVLGIRSIGVTLSAVLAAALKRRGSAASRITVRPTGHPYERRLAFSEGQRSWIRSHAGSQFLIIDEGPGLSGSSFLAVAEALTEAGVKAKDILLIGSRWPDPSQLRSSNAAERWSRFRFTCLESAPYLPDGAAIPIGGGQWRDEFLSGDEARPAAWTQLEMAKFLSADRRLFYKFEGFGHFGGEIGRRARVLAAAGLGPEYLGSSSGFGIYGISSSRRLQPAEFSPELQPQRMENRHSLGTPEFHPSTPMSGVLGTPELLRRLAEYCAFRLRQFPADDSQPSALDEMASWNWSLEFGPTADYRALEVEHRVFCDARMMPHKWLISPDGRLLKLDGVAHGDDHFFPGPCDIAWDLAGTIIEWKLQGPEQEYFLEQYRRASGDDARRRLPAYLKAYAAFRFGWCKMAALASAGTADEPLLWRDFQRYRACAASLGGITVSAEAAPAPAALAAEVGGEADQMNVA